jgi:glutamate-5-semialdehyde dehydrogenase
MITFTSTRKITKSMSQENAYQTYFARAKEAKANMTELSPEKINTILYDLAVELEARTESILVSNALDLSRMDPADPKYDRLQLTEARIKGMAYEIRNVANLESPLGKTLSESRLDNGLHIRKVTVPLGVIGMIYEARPNVTIDAFSLCFKTGNVCLLKGGSDADHSNKTLVDVIHSVLQFHDIPEAVAQLLPPERQSTAALLEAVGWVDVVIPRGSQGLIDFVREHAKVPVIETGAGVVHTFLDESADLHKSKAIIDNAKTRRVSVCNALDCLLVHVSRVGDLPALLQPLAEKGVQIFADDQALQQLANQYPDALLKLASEKDYGTEFLSLKLAVKTVPDFAGALEHIRKFSSGHSEAILTENKQHADRFVASVDAAAVYVNTSTAFTDGAQFGLGAEIGISTQKLHARGPMGLEALTSYKWVVRGDGQVRA